MFFQLCSWFNLLWTTAVSKYINMGLFSITEATCKIIGNRNANCGKSISFAPCKFTLQKAKFNLFIWNNAYRCDNIGELISWQQRLSSHYCNKHKETATGMTLNINISHWIFLGYTGIEIKISDNLIPKEHNSWFQKT